MNAMNIVLNRRDFLSLLTGGAALSILSPALSLAGELHKAPTKMNVLFIAVDDLRPQLACYNQTQIISPNIDRLAARGLLFERTYCQQAVCAPSRSSLLSGCRPDTTGIYHLNTPLRRAMPNVLTLPEHFKNHGYETVSIGKIYHHANDDLQGWSTSPYRARGTWKGRGYLTDEAIKIMRRYNSSPGSEKRKKGLGPAFEAAEVPDNAYPDGKNIDFALTQLDRLREKPFFLAVGLYKPHLPFNAPKKYWDMYPPEKIHLADNPFIPGGAPQYATTNWGELRSYYGIPKKGNIPDQLARRLIHGYYACVTYIDAQIGRLLDQLDRLKLRDHTMIILWGDHGWKLGEHAGWSKHTNFELDTRVPMIISVPGMKTAGRRTAALTEFVDIYPTLCDLCRLPLPPHLEGLSLKPLLQNPRREWKTAAFSQYPRGGVMGYSMRTQRYRYTEWKDRKSNQLQARELYDHQQDPQENINVVNQPEYAVAVQKLARMMKRSWRGARPQEHSDPAPGAAHVGSGNDK